MFRPLKTKKNKEKLKSIKSIYLHLFTRCLNISIIHDYLQETFTVIKMFWAINNIYNSLLPLSIYIGSLVNVSQLWIKLCFNLWWLHQLLDHVVTEDDQMSTQRAAAKLHDDSVCTPRAQAAMATAQRHPGVSFHAHHAVHPSATCDQRQRSGGPGQDSRGAFTGATGGDVDLPAGALAWVWSATFLSGITLLWSSMSGWVMS